VNTENSGKQERAPFSLLIVNPELGVILALKGSEEVWWLRPKHRAFIRLISILREELGKERFSFSTFLTRNFDLLMKVSEFRLTPLSLISFLNGRKNSDALDNTNKEDWEAFLSLSDFRLFIFSNLSTFSLERGVVLAEFSSEEEKSAWRVSLTETQVTLLSLQAQRDALEEEVKGYEQDLLLVRGKTNLLKFLQQIQKEKTSLLDSLRKLEKAVNLLPARVKFDSIRQSQRDLQYEMEWFLGTLGTLVEENSPEQISSSEDFSAECPSSKIEERRG